MTKPLSVRDVDGWRVLRVEAIELDTRSMREREFDIAQLVCEHELDWTTIRLEQLPDGGVTIYGKPRPPINWAEVEPPELTPAPKPPAPPVVHVHPAPVRVQVIRRGWLW